MGMLGNYLNYFIEKSIWAFKTLKNECKNPSPKYFLKFIILIFKSALHSALHFNCPLPEYRSEYGFLTLTVFLGPIWDILVSKIIFGHLSMESRGLHWPLPNKCILKRGYHFYFFFIVKLFWLWSHLRQKTVFWEWTTIV